MISTAPLPTKSRVGLQVQHASSLAAITRFCDG